MTKSTEITMEKAREMAEYVKMHATETITYPNFNECCVMGALDVKYFLIYENEVLVQIIRECKIDYEDFINEYNVEQTKEIVIYGTKIKYNSKDKYLVNEFITACNNYMQDIADISEVINIKDAMYKKGICDSVYDDEIINMKYGCYKLID